ncbi:MAG: hypothetical protein AB7S41_12910 [Parvibaculaceae bacterium]
MTTIPLARCLDELWPDGRAPSSKPPVPIALVAPVQPPESLFEEAYEHGRQEAFAVARAEYERALGEHRRQFDEQLAAEREKWTAHQSDAITARIGDSFTTLQTTLSGAVSQVLKPFLVEVVRERVVEDLARLLEELIAKGRASHLRIAGPEDLLAALRARLAGHAGVEYVPAPGGELEVEADRTVIETRLAEWRDRIEELTA